MQRNVLEHETYYSRRGWDSFSSNVHSWKGLWWAILDEADCCSINSAPWILDWHTVSLVFRFSTSRGSDDVEGREKRLLRLNLLGLPGWDGGCSVWGMQDRTFFWISSWSVVKVMWKKDTNSIARLVFLAWKKCSKSNVTAYDLTNRQQTEVLMICTYICTYREMCIIQAKPSLMKYINKWPYVAGLNILTRSVPSHTCKRAGPICSLWWRRYVDRELLIINMTFTYRRKKIVDQN